MARGPVRERSLRRWSFDSLDWFRRFHDKSNIVIAHPTGNKGLGALDSPNLLATAPPRPNLM